jgi:hypothetical protein
MGFRFGKKDDGFSFFALSGLCLFGMGTQRECEKSKKSNPNQKPMTKVFQEMR